MSYTILSCVLLLWTYNTIYNYIYVDVFSFTINAITFNTGSQNYWLYIYVFFFFILSSFDFIIIIIAFEITADPRMRVGFSSAKNNKYRKTRNLNRAVATLTNMVSSYLVFKNRIRQFVCLYMYYKRDWPERFVRILGPFVVFGQSQVVLIAQQEQVLGYDHRGSGRGGGGVANRGGRYWRLKLNE